MQKVALIPGGLDLKNAALRLSDSSTDKFAIQMINMQMCIPNFLIYSQGIPHDQLNCAVNVNFLVN